MESLKNRQVTGGGTRQLIGMVGISRYRADDGQTETFEEEAMLLKEMGLKARIVLLVVVTIGTLAVVGGVLFRALATTQGAYQRVLDRQVEQMEHALRISVDMLSARRAEKDFLASKDMRYVDMLKGHVGAVQTDAQLIAQVEQQIGHADGQKLTADIVAYIQDYQDKFLQLVQAWQVCGLDPDSGLQGAFRSAAHTLESAIDGYPGLTIDYLTLRRHEKDYLLRLDAGYVQEADSVLRELRAKVPAVVRDPRVSGKVVESLDTYERGFHALVGQGGRIAGLEAQMREAVDRIEPLVESSLADASGEKTRMLAETRRSVRWTTYSALAIGLLGLALVVMVLLLAMRSILRQVGGEPAEIAALASRVADGDLAASGRNGKASGIARALDTMVERLNRTVREIAEAATQVASAGEEISSSAQQLASGAQNQASTLEETSASVEELTASVEQVAEHAQSQAASVEESSGSMQQMQSSVEQVSKTLTEVAGSSREAMQKAQSGVEAVGKAVEAIQAIAASSEQIAGIIGVIGDIADQTNLLALNASIEAARAGEHGRGFAVVADEVSKLADRSSSSTKEIEKLIKEIG